MTRQVGACPETSMRSGIASSSSGMPRPSAMTLFLAVPAVPRRHALPGVDPRLVTRRRPRLPYSRGTGRVAAARAPKARILWK